MRGESIVDIEEEGIRGRIDEDSLKSITWYSRKDCDQKKRGTVKNLKKMLAAMLEESMILQLCKSVQERPLGRRIPHLNVALMPKVLSL